MFGSYARGDVAQNSDIDLLLLFAEVADPNKRAAELYAALVDFPHSADIVVSTTFRFERYRNVVNSQLSAHCGVGQKGDRHEVSQERRNSRQSPFCGLPGLPAYDED